MLHAENQDRLYLVAQSDEQQALIDGLAINVRIASGWSIAPWVVMPTKTCPKSIFIPAVACSTFV